MVDAERERFETWATSKMRRDEASAMLARSKGGDYVLPAARAGWAAWQARGNMDDERLRTEADTLMWRTHNQPATLLRAIQLDAAYGINWCAQLSPTAKDAGVVKLAGIFSGIHQRVAIAMQLKPAAPGADDKGR